MKIGRLLGIAAGSVVLLLLTIVIFANTGPGRLAITGLLNPLLGGDVVIQGLSGRFPDAPTAEHVEVRDSRGVWLTLDRVSAKWSPLQLLHNRIVAHTISAERATLLRRPLPSTSQGTTPPIDVKHLEIGELTIGRDITPRTALVSMSGSLHYVTSHQFSGALRVVRLDTPGAYQLNIALNHNALRGTAELNEPADGLIAETLHIPGIGALTFKAKAAGSEAGNRISADLRAGPLRANLGGIVDLAHDAAALSFSAASSAVSLAPGVSWLTLVSSGTLHGPIAAPDANGQVELTGLKTPYGSAARISAQVSGRKGVLSMNGTIAGLRLPDSYADWLAGSPVKIEAHANLAAPRHSFDVVLSHPVILATARIVPGEQTIQTVASVSIPSLANVADITGVHESGSMNLSAVVTSRTELSTIAMNGVIRLSDTKSAIGRLIGRDGRLAGLTTLRGGSIVVDQATLEGAGVAVSTSGWWHGDSGAAKWTLLLKDLSNVLPTLRGRVFVHGTLADEKGDFAASAQGVGDIATKGYASGPLRLKLGGKGFPRTPQGSIDISGTFDKAPLAIAVKLDRDPERRWHFVLGKVDWRSMLAHGELRSSPSFAAPTGRIGVHVGTLADFEPVIGEAIKGSLDGTVILDGSWGHARANVNVTGGGLDYEGAHIATARIGGTVDDPVGKPVMGFDYTVGGFTLGQMGGNAKGRIDGPLTSLGVALSAELHAPNGLPIALATAANVDAVKRRLTLTRYDVVAGSNRARLLAPAHFDLSNGIAVDSLRIGAGTAEFDAAGRFVPTLSATFSLRHAGLDLAKPMLPGQSARGTLSGTARLSGTVAEPQGVVSLSGKALQLGVDAGGAMPPADLTATANLHRNSMTINATVRSGAQMAFTLAGEVPLKPDARFNLHATGIENLAVFDPILTAEGRSLHGMLAVNAQVTGTFARPLVSGSGRISGGEFQDYVRGIRLSNLAANFDAHGEAIAINQFSARAGEGALTGSGTIDLTAPGEPVALTVTASNARPIANDVLNTTLDARLRLSGKLAESLVLSGNVNLRRAEINIPDSLPPNVAVLNIRGRGKPPPPKPILLNLDLTVRSGGQMFVRGHGLDAEMSGKIHVGGTTDEPDVSGGFELRRGNLSIAGQTLDFSSGRVSFDGSSLTERIDPALDFSAQTTAGGTTAILNVGGHASLPKITLSSTPPLPQDEILSRLLFQQGITQLSPWQVAQLGQALASMSGMGGGLGDPLTRVRRSLGLDRLAVSSTGSTGTETALEAGRYVARNVYVGAKQGVSGAGGTQAVVQVDLTKHLKLQTQISSNNAPTPVTPGTTPVDTGSNLGLSYQFEY